MTASTPELLPPGACLLHIGPYKTGSTALQTALFEARDALAEHGVAYPGRWRRAMRPGWAVLGYTPRGRRPTPIAVWEEFSAEVREAVGLRVCVSTEDFGSAGPERITRIVEDLGGERVHVVAVLRRLDRLLPSQWQERVKSHDTITFDEWLTRVLGDDAADREHQRFWASHDVVAMADRWLPVVGRDRFVLVAADEADPTVVPRAFEQMLGLPAGLLVLPPSSNASLSANATELVRRVNELFEREGWSDATYHRMIQKHAVPRLIDGPRSPLEEPIPPLPGWAAARAAEISEQRMAALAERGVRVVGDVSGLRPQPQSDAEGRAPRPPELLDLDTAARAVAGLVEATLAELDAPGAAGRPGRKQPARRRGRGGTSAPQAPTVDAASGRQLLREAARRAGRRVPGRGARRTP